MRHYVRALNMKHTLEFVFIERYAMLSTNKMAAQAHAVRCLFCQLRKWPPARMLGHVYRPVRPLVLIYNSMVCTFFNILSALYFVVWYLPDVVR